ncbi:MAG: zinc/iron-chelating domain-containing protein [Desulfuromonas sp.]|nr:MAG: zinc/iron-chelating domain-containing protein [Desulfuromonas sp.]
MDLLFTVALQESLQRYQELLEEVDVWFSRCQQKHPTAIRCAHGCSGCCRGLFDISLLDAALLQQGVRQLPAQEQATILARCRQRAAALEQLWPDFAPPYQLNLLDEALWQEMPEDDLTPCPLLRKDGCCTVYPFRPMTCRLHGLPNIDSDGTLFSDNICSLNRDGSLPLDDPSLRHPFNDLFSREFALLRPFNKTVRGANDCEFDTFIPTALLIDFRDLFQS